MFRIHGLELLFNIEKNNISSKEDCIVVVIHSLLLNEGFCCVGNGDERSESNSTTTTEMLPNEWNRNQNEYSLRYNKQGYKENILMTITKTDHLLIVNMARNEDLIAHMHVPFEKYVTDNYDEYSTAYKELESLDESFKKEVIEIIQSAFEGLQTSAKIQKKGHGENEMYPCPTTRPQANLEKDDEPRRRTFPEVGNRDLDPLGRGTGGMVMDPCSFGIPRRPTLPDCGVGNPGGLPRGAVPPGSRFDPITPPVCPGGTCPDPDHLKPPKDKPDS